MTTEEAHNRTRTTQDVDLSLSDSEAIRRVTSGDEHQFEVIMRRHNQRLFRIARSVLTDDQLALDALQNGYVKAYGALSTVEKPNKLGAWLNTVVRNEALMLRRKQARELRLDEHVERNLTAEEAWMSIPSPGPESTLMTAELRALLEEHVDDIHEDFREVFVLRAVEGMRTREVSQLLGVPESTVKTRYFRARQALQESLGGSFKDIYPFDGERCDRVAHNVLKAIEDKHPS